MVSLAAAVLALLVGRGEASAASNSPPLGTCAAGEICGVPIARDASLLQVRAGRAPIAPNDGDWLKGESFDVHVDDPVELPDGTLELPSAWQGGDGASDRDLDAEEYWFKTEVLDLHNIFRCRHGAPPLVWSISLEKNAKRWAATGRGHMSPPYLRADIAGFEMVGENVARDIKNHTGDYSPTWAVEMWYSKKPANATVIDSSHETDPFTQLVWKSTTEIGCGLNRGLGVFVCQYGPTGNTFGNFAAEVGNETDDPEACW
mmetsp:Transcript_97003/g.190475  ORF Transcript_97003/g.190475 Transcript_97003/m.190475 type:complete len:260 (+) Transcript_97003:49-828(+)